MQYLKLGDELVIDIDRRLLYKAGNPLTLPDLSFRLLQALVERAPAVVTHDELMTAVWGDRVVGDENLKQRITRLRRALGDSPDAPRYILAVRGVGYRCIAEVTVASGPVWPETGSTTETAPARTVQSQSRFSRRWVLAYIGAAIIGAGLFLGWQGQMPVSPDVDGPHAGNQLEIEFGAEDYARRALDYYYRFQPRDNDTAISLYRRSVTVDPNFSGGYAGLANAYAQGYLQFGQDYSWTDKALDYARTAVQLAPDQAGAHKALGLSLYARDRFDEALAAYRRASELVPGWAAPINNSALIFQQQGRLVKAYDRNLEAIRLNVKDPIPYQHLGNTFRDLGLAEHAYRAYLNAVQLKPDYLLAHNYLAEYYLNQQQYDKALAEVSQTLALSARNSRALWLGGLALMMQDRKGEAADYFRRVVEYNSDKYRLHAEVRLALLQARPQQLPQLQQRLEQLLAGGSQWADYPYLLALVQLARGQQDAALASLQQAIEFGLTDHRWLGMDPRLQSLREDPAFRQMLTTLVSRVTAMREQVLAREYSRRGSSL